MFIYLYFRFYRHQCADGFGQGFQNWCDLPRSAHRPNMANFCVTFATRRPTNIVRTASIFAHYRNFHSLAAKPRNCHMHVGHLFPFRSRSLTASVAIIIALSCVMHFAMHYATHEIARKLCRNSLNFCICFADFPCTRCFKNRNKHVSRGTFLITRGETKTSKKNLSITLC